MNRYESHLCNVGAPEYRRWITGGTLRPAVELRHGLPRIGDNRAAAHMLLTVRSNWRRVLATTPYADTLEYAQRCLASAERTFATVEAQSAWCSPEPAS